MIETNVFDVFSSESKLQKEHDISCKLLKDWKKRFKATLDACQKEVNDFKHKDRMSEAEQYVVQLQNISNRLDEFLDEVQWRLYLLGSPLLHCVVSDTSTFEATGHVGN